MIPDDKIKHFWVGFLLSGLGIFWFPLVILGFIFAVGKEIYDGVTGKGVVEFYDVVATMMGSISAICCIIIISWII
jgi:hypothetical protein